MGLLSTPSRKKMSPEMHYQAEQEARAAAQDAQAEADETAITKGTASLTLQTLIDEMGLPWVTAELKRIEADRAAQDAPNCARCRYWNDRWRKCGLRAELELPELPTSHARHCPYWHDLFF